MKKLLLLIAFCLFTVAGIQAQDSLTSKSAIEQELLDLSTAKWNWMSEKNVDALEKLFHENAQFVHMGGYWGKQAELQTIGSGGIWYKKADVHNAEVKFAGPVATVYSVIHLTAEVGGHEVINPFFVTEVYVMNEGRWQLTSLSFTRGLGD